jgi:hypothetical protein
VKEEIRSTLSAEERAELARLTAELHGLRKRWRRLAARLEPARGSSARALVRDRLLCVLLDCVEPALRDLRSIEDGASSPPGAAEAP